MFQTSDKYNYYVYIITNKTRTVLYIGFTKNLKERLNYHQNPEANSKAFTARYKYYYLLYWEHYSDVQAAINRETQLKKWSREKKENLIRQNNPEFRFFNDEI
ncbi:GIY-YIG nuclease family protein [Flavobacterium rhizosphaerae]|uniref:GIY-YIG nuclease family protein n=1 Tax=Flavobacterium rhizosphaerae TaxID=3163298 RepID=A0ABW8Z2D6_9FLAO